MDASIRDQSPATWIVSKSLVPEAVHKNDISNAMNSFFCSVGKDTNKIDRFSPKSPLLAGDCEINKRKAAFHFRTIEVHENRDACATTKTAKSFGTDNISNYFLGLAAFLLNTSIETSRFPDSWKVARVAPIFKNGDKTEKSQTIDQYQSCLSSQGSLKN